MAEQKMWVQRSVAGCNGTSVLEGHTGKPLSGSVLAFEKPCCKRGVGVFCESALGFSSVSLGQDS